MILLTKQEHEAILAEASLGRLLKELAHAFDFLTICGIGEDDAAHFSLYGASHDGQTRREIISDDLGNGLAALAGRQTLKKCGRCKQMRPLGMFSYPNRAWASCRLCERNRIKRRRAAAKRATASRPSRTCPSA